MVATHAASSHAMKGPMTQTLVLVHTIPLLVGAFDEWCRALLPGVRPLHVLDEPMLERIRRRGYRAPEDDERLAEHVAGAESIGANAVLVTCSSVSLSAGAIRSRARIPVFTIDDPMTRAAIRIGDRIAVVATAATTLDPSRAMLELEGARVGRSPAIRLRFVDAALAALLAGDPATHDRLVVAAVREEARDADVVVLAQATMARVLDLIAERPVAVPVLASPQLALAEVRRGLESHEPAAQASAQPEVRP